jgi:hypothetical protein
MGKPVPFASSPVGPTTFVVAELLLRVDVGTSSFVGLRNPTIRVPQNPPFVQLTPRSRLRGVLPSDSTRTYIPTSLGWYIYEMICELSDGAIVYGKNRTGYGGRGICVCEIRLNPNFNTWGVLWIQVGFVDVGANTSISLGKRWSATKISTKEQKVASAPADAGVVPNHTFLCTAFAWSTHCSA